MGTNKKIDLDTSQKFKFCLLDTCILSEFYKNPKTIGRNITSKYIDEVFYFMVSVDSIRELVRVKSIFDSFFNFMSILPTVILKSYYLLIEDEIKNYNQGKVNPILVQLPTLEDNSYYNDLKNGLLEYEGLMKSQLEENETTLTHMMEWIEGYPPQNRQYTKEEIEQWVDVVTIKTIAMIDPLFLEKNNNIDFTWFKGAKCLAYITFYKFYLKHRKPRVSDVTDISMSSVFPYIDILITEKDMAETIRQLQRKHNFLTNLEVYTIKDFRD